MAYIYIPVILSNVDLLFVEPQVKGYLKIAILDCEIVYYNSVDGAEEFIMVSRR